jgi:hypothetical protein
MGNILDVDKTLKYPKTHYNPLYSPDLRPVTVEKEEITVVTITPLLIVTKIIKPEPPKPRRFGTPATYLS